MLPKRRTYDIDHSEIVETSCRVDFDKIFGDDSFIHDSTFSLSVFNELEVERNDIFLQIPHNVKEELNKHRNISQLFEWQERILELPCIYNQGNLIYSSPTGGGKTLVSELIMMREVLTNGKNAIYIVPYVSLAHEKVSSLSPLGCSLGFHVEEYASSKGSIPPRKRYRRKSIYIATIEKASLLINSLFEEDRMDSIGVIVVDEIHMLNEPKRGVILEILLARIIFKQLKIQLIGMSATLKNIDDLCSFLNATYFTSSQRPIELKEFICLDKSLFSVNSADPNWQKKMRFERSLYQSNDKVSKNMDILIQLTSELTESSPCLIFCPNRKNCEITCELLAKQTSIVKSKFKDRVELIKSLEYVSGGVCPILRACIPRGIAYHHAGMADDERKIIEEGYLCGTIYVLCCTSTLAAGVNLPAFRVIIKSPFVGTETLSSVNYKQMIGRAGRPGLSESGESIILIEQSNRNLLDKIFNTDHISLSALRFSDFSEISTIILSLTIHHSFLDKDEIINFFKITLFFKQLHSQEEIDKFISKIDQAIEYLLKNKLVTKTSTSVNVTQFGSSLVESGIEVKRFENILNTLKNSLNSMVLSSDLHLIYICCFEEIFFPQRIYKDLHQLLSGLTNEESNLITHTGLSETEIFKFSQNAKSNSFEFNSLIVRWFHALLIYQLYKGRSVWSAYHDFDVSRGSIQQLITLTVSNASSLFRLVKNLDKYWCLKILLQEMVKKISMINCLDVLPLLEISGVKLARAKQLFQAGYRTLSDIASANIENLIDTIPHLSRRQASCIISSSRLLIREQGETLQEEADQILAKIPQSKLI